MRERDDYYNMTDQLWIQDGREKERERMCMFSV